MSYDSACHDLAQLFLDAESMPHTDGDVQSLAARIQNAVEDWFFIWEDTKKPVSPTAHRLKE